MNKDLTFLIKFKILLDKLKNFDKLGIILL